ncbi:argininosuccinate lyase [Pontimonas sp.]|nr:argininosuccinate lyase [Pontimonas sp.]MDB4606921.1 argininosuccinate lyase [Pontimonas sp.]
MAGETNAGALWGARFAHGPSEAMAALSRSTHFDWRLVPYDLAATRAHAAELHDKGFLSPDDFATVGGALEALSEEYESGSLVPADADEDVHGALERILIERVGPTLGGALRAGRSRNDQIATFVRLYMRDSAQALRSALLEVAQVLHQRASEVGDAVMPGRTHYQLAQPVLVGHYLMAHAWPLVRDVSRIDDFLVRNDVSPYGGGALAGGGVGLSPEAIGAALGFASVSTNSLDGTSSRDGVAEFLFIAAQIGVDLSRVAEDIIVLSSGEFGYLTLDDAFSTGSSMMPQKKNPDIAELARGKAGRLIGNLTGLLATLKALPLAYNRDLQEDKEPLFDSVDSLLLVLPAMSGLLETLTFNLDVMAAGSTAGFALATDVADSLVANGVPFREAHEVVGQLVSWCEQHGVDLPEVSDAELSALSPHLAPSVREVMSADASVARKSGRGGTAPARVAQQRDELASVLNALQRH